MKAVGGDCVLRDGPAEVRWDGLEGFFQGGGGMGLLLSGRGARREYLGSGGVGGNINSANV